jgi:hypothetical protein
MGRLARLAIVFCPMFRVTRQTQAAESNRGQQQKPSNAEWIEEVQSRGD